MVKSVIRVGKCKLCGRIVEMQQYESVKMGGRTHTVCERCEGKKIPMMRNVPGKEIRGVPALEGLR